MKMNLLNKIINERENLRRQKYWLKSANVIFKKNTFVDIKTVFEGQNVISPETRFYDSVIGFATYFGRGCIITSTKVGRFCSIGPRLRIIVGQHPTSNFVSTHPAFFSLQKQAGFSYVNEQLFKEINYIDEEKKMLVEIGNDVWIGSDVRIMEGVKIEDGAIIAAGAIVVKDVPAYSIVGGVPAKTIKMRFDKDEIEFLIELKWWNKDANWIKENAEYFINVEKLIYKLRDKCN